jgi:predicted dehydrogenase
MKHKGIVRYGIVGVGRMGSIHARNLAKGFVKGAMLAAVCDSDTTKLNKIQSHWPDIAVYEDYAKMFSEGGLDAVVVATPHYSHVQIVIAALQAGLHVLSEKPASVTVSEAQRAIDEARKHPELAYGIMYNQRTNRMYAYAKKLLEQNALGDIKRITLTVTDWYRSQFYYDMGGWRASWKGEGGGLLINQCVHQLDILQWLVGMPEGLTAWAETRNRKITVENDVVAVMDYKNGAKCVFTAIGHELKGSNLLEIAGDKGKITIGKFKMRYLRFAKSETEVNATTKRGYGFTTAKKKTLTYGIGNALNELHCWGQQVNILRDFTSHLRFGTPLLAPGEEGIKALSIINAIYLSAYTGNRRISFPVDPSEYDQLLISLKAKENR